MPDNTPTRSVLRRRGRAFPALPPTTMTSAETLLRQRRRPFRREAGLPQVRAALLHHTAAASTPRRLDHKSFAVCGPLALLGSAFYAVLVHRLMIYAPRFLPTVDYSSAVALHFAHCGQLTAGLTPARVRPCWAHHAKTPAFSRAFFYSPDRKTVVPACAGSTVQMVVVELTRRAAPFPGRPVRPA